MSEWIKLSEREPPEVGDYICACLGEEIPDNGNIKKEFYLEICRYERFWETIINTEEEFARVRKVKCSFCTYANVVYWQPLPQLPVNIS